MILFHDEYDDSKKKPEPGVSQTKLLQGGNVCECRRLGKDYKPARMDVGVRNLRYYCQNCNKFLSFKDMDYFYWTLPDSGPIPISEMTNNPYTKDGWYM